MLARSWGVALPDQGEAKFWVIDLRKIVDAEIEEAKGLLDEETLARCNRFLFEEERKQSILTHAILRVHLEQLIGKKASEIEILRTPLGKPYLEDHSLHFNLSHTKEFAFLGVHFSQSIGVDIEAVQENHDLLKALGMFFEPEELDSVEKTPKNLIRFWCAKEALLKAKGTGLATHQLPRLKPVSNSLFSSEGVDIHVCDSEVEGHVLAFCLFPLHGGGS